LLPTRKFAVASSDEVSVPRTAPWFYYQGRLRVRSLTEAP
jgi:hypothetical protein